MSTFIALQEYIADCRRLFGRAGEVAEHVRLTLGHHRALEDGRLMAVASPHDVTRSVKPLIRYTERIRKVVLDRVETLRGRSAWRVVGHRLPNGTLVRPDAKLQETLRQDLEATITLGRRVAASLELTERALLQIVRRITERIRRDDLRHTDDYEGSLEVAKGGTAAFFSVLENMLDGFLRTVPRK